jgi:hypothetical protein
MRTVHARAAHQPVRPGRAQRLSALECEWKRTPASGARTAPHHGATGGERLQHEPRQGLHREHPRRMVNPPDMARRTNSQLGGRATRRRKLTGNEGVT